MEYYLCWNKGMTPTLGKLISDTLYADRRIFEVATGEGTIFLREFDFYKEIKVFSVENREISNIELYSKFIHMKNLQITSNFGYSDDNYCYQENIKHLRGDTYIYVDLGNVAMPESLEDLFEILPQNNKKRKLIQFLREYSNYLNYKDFTSFENVVAYIFGDYSIETMKDFVNNLIEFGIEVTPKFDRYVSRGYSQGDACEIFVPHSLREVWGLTDDAEVLTKDLQKQIDHYLWDSKIYGTIDISFEYEVKRETFGDSVIIKFAEEFEYGEWSNDAFEFDLDVDNILKCINRVTNNVLNEDEILEIRKSLESLDQSDVKYN